MPKARFHDFLQLMSHLRASMIPNSEYTAPLIDMSKLENLDMVDLSQVPDKTIALAAGYEYANLGFTMRVDDTEKGRIVNIWNDPKANGLTGPLECIASYTRPNWKFEINGDVMEYEPGVIRKGEQFVMPYFQYALGDGKSVMSGFRDWNDKWGGILVQYPPTDLAGHVDSYICQVDGELGPETEIFRKQLEQERPLRTQEEVDLWKYRIDLHIETRKERK